MSLRTIDPATIYQIFYQDYQGVQKHTIARQLGISTNAVRWHLQGRYLHNYPPSTLRRIKALPSPKLKEVPIDPPWIRISDVTHFLPWRPSPRTICDSAVYATLHTTKYRGIVVTNRDWILDFLLSLVPELPEGLCLTHNACEKLQIAAPRIRTEPRFCKFVKATQVALPAMPAALVHWAIAVQDWTSMPFVSISASDVCAFR